jgi:uncharacterized damage-inducible protein DinB
MKWPLTTYSKKRLKGVVSQFLRKEHEMKFRAIASAVLLVVLSSAAFAQTGDKTSTKSSPEPKADQPSQGPFSTFNKFTYARVKTILIGAAEKMPEENYNFKPSEAVRSYGQIVGHVADAQYIFCSMALGEKNPELKIEQSKTSKAELVAALKEAVSYCDKAYDTMNDSAGAQMVKLFGMDMPKLGVLNINNMHDMEHYGNLVTYMRMKNIVPPTSESAPAAQPKK